MSERPKIGEHLEVDVLDKIWSRQKIKRKGYRGRGYKAEWHLETKVKKCKTRGWCEGCWCRIFSWFRKSNLQTRKCMQEDQKEGRDKEMQDKMAIMARIDKQIRAAGRMDAQRRWWVSGVVAQVCEEAGFES